MARKTKPAFITFLAVISIMGFLSYVFQYFKLITLNNYINPSIFMLIGIALIIEGNLRAIKKYFKNGLDSDEITHLLAITVGIIALISGFVSYPFIGIQNNVFETFKLILSIFTIVIIIIETWVVK